MKKLYIRPELYSEDLELSAVITTACGSEKPIGPLEVPGFSDDPESEEDPVSRWLFLEDILGCTTIITLNNAETELGDSHYWCYQNPSDATRIFMS